LRAKPSFKNTVRHGSISAGMSQEIAKTLLWAKKLSNKPAGVLWARITLIFFTLYWISIIVEIYL
jgi:hypothetical protein